MKYIDAIFKSLEFILKLPSWIWKLPYLNKIQGYRTLLVAGLTALLGILTTTDWGGIADALCGVLNCNPEKFMGYIAMVSTWIIAVLKIEDKAALEKIINNK